MCSNCLSAGEPNIFRDGCHELKHLHLFRVNKWTAVHLATQIGEMRCFLSFEAFVETYFRLVFFLLHHLFCWRRGYNVLSGRMDATSLSSLKKNPFPSGGSPVNVGFFEKKISRGSKHLLGGNVFETAVVWKERWRELALLDLSSILGYPYIFFFFKCC